MTTRDDFLKQYPLVRYLEDRGVTLHGNSTERTANCCAGVQHKPAHLCVSINVDEEIWRCHDCETGGSVIDWIAIQSGRSAGDVLKEFEKDHRSPCFQNPSPKKNGNGGNGHAAKPSVSDPAIKYEIEATYSYADVFGREIFQAVRMRPKTFRQRHSDGKGGWIWNMDGVERVLYRLQQVLLADIVAVTEGEKDANTLVQLGYCGTCNVGGAGKWLDGYTETLEGKDVLIFGDNDKAGQEHVETVFESIAGKVKSVRIIQIPKSSKDISEFVSTFTDNELARAAVNDLIEAAHPFLKGIRLPIYTMADTEGRYIKHVQNLEQNAFSLGNWLPSLATRVRRLVPGELVLLIGNTGVGKTALLSNIALAARPLPTLMFELELPCEMLFERFVASKTDLPCRIVEETYASGETLGTAALAHHFPHLYLCWESRQTVDQLEAIISRSELKIGRRPKVVLLDYVQLVGGPGKGRYERVSNVAEELKIIAKATQTIIFVASQISRPDDDDPEITLHDAKESGSLENSSGLVLGVWRDPDNAALLHLKILKNTKGACGKEILCNFHLETMRITEQSQVSDVPAHSHEPEPQHESEPELSYQAPHSD